MNELTNILNELMAQNDKTIKDVADDTGLRYNLVYKLTKGLCTFSPSTRQKLNEVFNTDRFSIEKPKYNNFEDELNDALQIQTNIETIEVSDPQPQVQPQKQPTTPVNISNTIVVKGVIINIVKELLRLL